MMLFLNSSSSQLIDMAALFWNLEKERNATIFNRVAARPFPIITNITNDLHDQDPDPSPAPVNLRCSYKLILKRVFLSCSPLDSSCVALAICNPLEELVFARPGDSCGRRVQCKLQPFQSVAFYKGKFYAITAWGCVGRSDIPKSLNCSSTSVAEAVVIAPDPPQVRPLFGSSFYVIESSGDLSQVVCNRCVGDELRIGVGIPISQSSSYIENEEDGKQWRAWESVPFVLGLEHQFLSHCFRSCRM